MSNPQPGFFDLSGRTAFVAGAYGDLGAAIARALVSSGVRVAVVSVRARGLFGKKSMLEA